MGDRPSSPSAHRTPLGAERLTRDLGRRPRCRPALPFAHAADHPDERARSVEGEETVMKALVVYESMFGNSRQVARAIASGLGEYAEVEVVPVADAPQAPSRDLDLVVAGGPTHAFSMSKPKTREDAVRRGAADAQTEFGLREWLKGLPDGHGARLVTFDTKVRRAPGSAAHRAAREAAAHGYVAPVRWMSFF